MRRLSLIGMSFFCAGALLTTSAAWGQEGKEGALESGKFPPPGSGHFLSGELVFVDPVNRRGALRLDGSPDGRYHDGPLHYFAMLPYGMAGRCGAPAELRDLPLGAHVQGYFYSPPAGEEATLPPLPQEHARHHVPYNHALSLEDDFSFYARRGQAWKVASIDVERGKINVAPVGQTVKEGINQPYTFDIDAAARVWKDRRLVEWTEITPEQTVQFNLGWAPGWEHKEFSIEEIWLDDASRQFVADLQRRRHVRFQKQRWLPGWIDAVEHFDYGGGVVTLTLFGGMDPALYAELKATQEKGYGVAVSDKTLRTWFHRADKKIGQVLEWKESPNPPPGSSGVQIRLKFTELLDGYRPGHVVRVKCDNWIFVTMPVEERLKSLEDQKRSMTMGLP